MADSILTMVQERRASSLAKSADFSERRERATATKASMVKTMLLEGTEGGNSLAAELNMRNRYYLMLEQFTGQMNFAVPTWTKRSESFWKRVVQAQEASGVTSEVFLKAQFHWFNKSFGKPPELKQLTTPASIARAQEFAQDTNVNKDRRVVANAQKANIPLADLMRQAEQQVRTMSRAQNMTREEFYRNLVVTGYVQLPQEFLKADPVYQRVKNG